MSPPEQSTSQGAPKFREPEITGSAWWHKVKDERTSSKKRPAEEEAEFILVDPEFHDIDD